LSRTRERESLGEFLGEGRNFAAQVHDGQEGKVFPVRLDPPENPCRRGDETSALKAVSE
jgi:hypothetical protein